MYKKAVITDEISQSIAEAAALAAKYSLDALEIRSVNERNPFQMTAADIIEVRDVAMDYGLDICCVSSPLFKISLEDDDLIEENIESFRRAMETLNTWGCQLIRGFDFMYSNLASKRERILDCYRRIIPIASDADVTVVLESEPSVNSRDIASLVSFIKELDSPRVKALFDPGNEICISSPYPEGYKSIKPYMAHVHIKDMTRSGNPAMLGEGDVDFNGIFSELKAGFDGFVSVETHFRFPSSDGHIDYVHPQGSSFSDGGHKATEEYLRRLDSLYRW